MELSSLEKLKSAQDKKPRVGRGIGSGHGGHTSGRGSKGQKARKGGNPNPGFEGGQVPLYKRLPQIGGFSNPHKKEVRGIDLSILNAFEEGSEITPLLLVQTGIVKKISSNGKVKLLSTGKIEKKLTLKGFIYSSSAKEALTKAGCTLID